jgi:hypothetical protein
MPQGDDVAVADQVADQIEVALHLGRDRQDAHLLTGACDHCEDVGPGKVLGLGGRTPGVISDHSTDS